jgi:hypothetical protein
MIDWPIQSIAESPVSIGSLLWGSQRGLHLTVVVKATFALPDDGSIALASPAPIHREEVLGDGGQRVRFAGDLAPYVPRADILFSGAGHAGGGRARLSVHRGGCLIDKALPPATAAKPWDAFGPVPIAWPARHGLLRGRDRSFLAAPVPHFPDDFDWAYFQAAPADQRVDVLHGDETLVLEGLHPRFARFSARLPAVRAEAHLLEGGPGHDGGGVPVLLRIDTLFVDGDAGTCSVVSRGVTSVQGHDALSRLVLRARVSILGAPALSPPQEAPARATTEPFPDAPAGERTYHLRPGEGPAAHPALPFAPATGVGTRAPARPVPGAPWSGEAAPAVPRPTVDVVETITLRSRPNAAPPLDDPSSTVALGASTHAAAAQRPATPFPAQLGMSPPIQNAPIAGAPWSGVSAKSAPTPGDVEETAKVPEDRGAARKKRGPDLRAEIDLMRARVAAAEALPLAKYAVLKADMWIGQRLEDVLAKHGVDAATWATAEKAWAEAMAREAAQGRSELSTAFSEALRAAGAKPPR